MKKLIIAALVAMTSGVAMAQEVSAPDYRAIRTSIQNAKGPNYYPHLMSRYVKNDTTLTIEQYRALYYGYTLREDYVPYQRTHKALTDIRQRIVDSNGDSKVCAEALKVSQTALEDNPFDLLAIATMTFSYQQLKDTMNYAAWNDKQNSLLDAIVSSGDGEEITSPIHVIDIEHEYEVLNRLGLQIESDSLCNDHVEYLKVLPNAEDIEGVYFDFSACRQAYRRKYE